MSRRWARMSLALSLALTVSVACSDDGEGTSGDGDGRPTGATSANETGSTGATSTGATGETNATGATATGATGETGGVPPRLSITLVGGCTLDENTGTIGGPYVLAFIVRLESVGGPFDGPRGSVSSDGQAPLTGFSTADGPYSDGMELSIRHALEESTLGTNGNIQLETVGTTRQLNVSVPEGLGPAPCHLA